MSAPDIQLRASRIVARAHCLMKYTKDDGVRVAACCVAESAAHLERGAEDPMCPSCRTTPPPNEGGFDYNTDDGCPVCHSDEYALFSWATSLVHLTGDLVREAAASSDARDLSDAVALSKAVSLMTARYGAIDTIIQTVRDAKRVAA